MISVSHIHQQLTGFWAMAFNHPGWRDIFDRGPEAILTSFWAMLPAGLLIFMGALAEPALINKMMADPSFSQTMDQWGMNRAGPAPAFPRVLTAMLAFFFSWFLTLGMLLRIARRLEGAGAMPDIIVGYNWLQVPFRLLSFIPIAIFLLTGSAAMMSITALPLFALSLTLVWGMLRRALPTTEWTVVVGIMICMGIVVIIAGIMASIIGGLFYTPPATGVLPAPSA